ncbi:MAG: hypothetical protein HOV87_13545 [Catenulispora sp.]|nr:hypothetical protein [Catenulispora sp.]
MKIPGAGTALPALAVVSMALTACGGSDPKVSVDTLQKAADAAIANPNEPCPLGLDLNAALKKAGIAATATPSTGTDPDDHPVDAVSGTGAKSDTPIARFGGGGMITCSYALSTGGSVEATLTGVHKPRAIGVIAPVLARDGQLAVGELREFIGRKFDAGKAVLTPDDGLAAVVVLKASGGDAILEVTSNPPAGNADAKNPIVREPLRVLAEELGKQVKV